MARVSSSVLQAAERDEVRLAQPTSPSDQPPSPEVAALDEFVDLGRAPRARRNSALRG